MKKNYVVPRTTSVDVVTENDFALTLSTVTGQGTGRGSDLTIGEDVWIGQNVTILPGANIGRGSVVAACSTMTKPVPPYAMVMGSPAKIVGAIFTIDQILEHEKTLYPENERFSREYLEELFAKYYEGKKVFGVQTELTSEDLAALERAKKVRRYIEPKL